VRYRREPRRVRDLVILFITGFVNDQRLAETTVITPLPQPWTSKSACSIMASTG
jgi:hypothetical protein